jgi:hypothetical protein
VQQLQLQRHLLPAVLTQHLPAHHPARAAYLTFLSIPTYT